MSATMEELEKILNVPRVGVPNLRRRTEDIQYWRQRAGWFDDDASMKNYNNGVYDTYYQLDDDGNGRKSHRYSRQNSSLVKNVLKGVCAVVAFAIFVVVLRAIIRRLSKKKDKKSLSSDSKSRSGRSHSRSRSRSRSKSRRADSDYKLMSDDADVKSVKSSRSKRSTRSKSSSKRRSSRSRSRPRSRSKSRGESKTAPPQAEPVLV